MAFPLSYSLTLEVDKNLADERVSAEWLRAAATALNSHDHMDVSVLATAVRFGQRFGYYRPTSSPPEQSCISRPDIGLLEIIQDHAPSAVRLTIGSEASVVQSILLAAVIVALVGRNIGWSAALALSAFGWLWLATTFHIRRVMRAQWFVRRHENDLSIAHHSIPKRFTFSR